MEYLLLINLLLLDILHLITVCHCYLQVQKNNHPRRINCFLFEMSTALIINHLIRFFFSQFWCLRIRFKLQNENKLMHSTYVLSYYTYPYKLQNYLFVTLSVMPD